MNNPVLIRTVIPIRVVVAVSLSSWVFPVLQLSTEVVQLYLFA